MFETITSPIDFMVHAGLPPQGMTWELNNWNPINDPVLDSFHVLILNLQRELAMRSGRFRRGYWQMLTQEEAWFAEAEADWLIESIKDVYVAQRMYSLSRLPSEPDDDFLSQDMANLVIACKRQVAREDAEVNQMMMEQQDNVHALTTRDIMRRVVEFEAASTLVPGNTPINQAELMLMKTRVNESTDQFSLFSRPNPRELEYLYRHRNYRSAFNGEIIEGFSAFVADIQHASLTHNLNEKTKAKGAPPYILVNDGIPAPRAASFMGWYGLCGVVNRKLNMREIERLLYWWDGGLPQHILTYIPPFMPRTHEHATGGQVVTGNLGDADWSLQSRSKYHARDSEGRIQYGHMRARTVVLGDDLNGVFKSRLVADVSFDSMTTNRMSLHELALDMLPGMDSTMHLLVTGDMRLFTHFEHFRFEEVEDLRIGSTTPVGGGDLLPFFPLGADYVTYRPSSIAQNWQIHMRFDESMIGTETLEDWCDAFEFETWQWLHRNRQERMQIHMHDVINRIYNVRNPKEFVHTNRAGVRTTFDFTGL